MNKIKEHFKKHKKLYIGIGIGAGVAGITCLIMRGRYEALDNVGAYGSKTADTLITMRPLSFFSNQNNDINVISRNGPGRPGYLIHNLESDLWFSSQRQAAKHFDMSETILSKHITGKIPNVDNLHFERVSIH